MSLASLDGHVGPAAEARISVTDEGLLRGDGAFEVLRLYSGRPFALRDHLDRLRRSCEGLRLDADHDALEAELAALLAASGGGRRIAIVEPLPERPPVSRVATVTFAPGRILDGLKTLSYAGNMLAGRLARERGCDEALLVTPHGRVLEGPTWTFFWVEGGKLFTPPLEERILASITRARLLEECDVSQCSCTLDDVRAAEEAFIASTVREVMPIAAVDDIELPAAPGPVTLDAHARFQARVERELAAAPA
jgi:branched-chain amino acid aminotransferase